jgi:hypothetical protein
MGMQFDIATVNRLAYVIDADQPIPQPDLQTIDARS